MLKRALVWGGAAVLCAFVAVGCGGGSADGGGGEEGRYREEIVIGWTPPDITGVFKTATNYFERAADEANAAGFNVKIQAQSPATHTAFADQLEIIENYVSQQVDVIAVSPADTEAIKPAIQRANDAGIPVIIVNLLEPQEDIDQYDGVELLGEPIAADWNREKGVEAAETFLSRYNPNEMNFIWAASNEMGLGAMAAAQRKGVLDDSGGRTPPEEGKVAIFTNDVTPESTAEIRDGKIIAETHHGFAEWGWIGTKFGVQLACGQEVPQTFDIRPRTVWQGNADQFYPNPNLPEIDWQKIKNDC